jgi:hypothetical protein
MESRLLSNLGKVAGIGGIALGLFLLIFRDILAKNILPQAGLEADHGFALIMAMMILTFGISGVGILAWIIARAAGPSGQVSNLQIGLVVVVILFVLIFSAYSGTPPPRPLPPPPPPPSPVPIVPMKPFSGQATLGERDAASVHGFLIRTGDIGINVGGDGRAYAVVSAGRSRDPSIRQLHRGESMELFEPDCERIEIVLKNVSIASKVPNATLEELAKFGPAAELFVERKAEILISGRCRE